ncbi:MAG: class I SAM-dependent methyltransferase [Thermodesulfobacteriota bacterium]|nr:class I SAM-dependent methyltransferase [Thermodesulfobacteriota bacterium]
MSDTNPENFKDELQRQESIQWERGKFYKAYETMMGKYIVKSVLEHARPLSLLDVACGNGLITSQLARRFSRVVGVEASSALIDNAREMYPQIEFIHSLAEEYRDPEGFTTITILNLLEHVIDPVDLLKRVSENLKPEGVIIANVPNALAANRRIARLMGSLESEYELSPFDINVAGHRRYYDMPMLIRDFESAVLRVIHKGGIFYKGLSSVQFNWLLEQGEWDKGGYGWGRVGAEKAKDWRQAFCDACYEFGKEHPEDCNLIYVVAQK